jgi:iron-sulfur cluster assembly protein
MAVTLTESAANHVRKMMASRGKGLGLRLGVRKSGCSGLAYTLDFVDEDNGQDVRFESHGVTVFVDSQSLQHVDGIELDYTREGVNEAFRFKNPNVKEECGCGESFST